MKECCNKLVKMLFNKEIEGLYDDGFDSLEGSTNESSIFKEVFFQNGCDTTRKGFRKNYSNHTDLSFCSNSESSESQLGYCNVKEDSWDNSAPRCFSEGRALLMRGDHDVNGKRMKLSVDDHPYSRPYSGAVLNSPAPSKGVVSGMYQSAYGPASPSVYHTVTCRLVESSSQGVTSSCYLLKQHADTTSRGQTGDRDVSNSRLQSLDGSDEKEENASKAIASPVSQDSTATWLLVTSPSVSVANKSRSHRCAKERMKQSNFDELPVANIPLNRDSMKDPRTPLRYHIQNLLRATGWEIGRRKREDNVRGEYLYFPPNGRRPIRSFCRVWNLCGQSLFAGRNFDIQEDGKQWIDMTHFWEDLSITFTEIEEELNNTETTDALARCWHLLDPFATMVFIDKKLGTLRAGKVVKARRSLVIDTSVKDAVLGMKTVGTTGNRSETNRHCGSSVARESASLVSEGIDRICKKKHDKGTSAYFRQLQRGALKALEGVSNYLSEDKCTRTTNTVSGTGTRWRDLSGTKRSRHDLISLQACDSTCDQFNSCLFEVPITYGTVNIMYGGSDPVSPRHDCNTNSLSCDRRRSCHSEKMALEVKIDVSMGSSEGETLNQHLGSQDVARFMRHSGHNESEKFMEASKFTMNGASSVSYALLKKKLPKKPKRTSETGLMAIYQNGRLGPSTCSKAEGHDFNMNPMRLESVRVKECFVASSGRIDTSCKRSFICSSKYWNGKKPSKIRKILENDSRKKRSTTRRLKDDDLLISAIIKNQTFGSSTKQSTRKTKSHKLEGLRKRKSQKGSCTLLPRSLGTGGKQMEGKWSISNVRTVLSWLINSGVVSLNEVMQYRTPKDDAVVKDGWVTRDGILCKCCNKVLCVSEFKIHAGFRLRSPCLNLFMESGKPFTLCQLEAWSSEYKARKSATRTVQVEVTDENDDRCGLCGDVGELICCDNCPSTFHQACLYAQELPEGSWYCPYCTCQICGNGGGYDQEPLKLPGTLRCSQCDHKYHEACLKEKGTNREVASDPWFCSESCQEVYLGLHSRLAFLNVLSDGFSWTLLRCIHGDKTVYSTQRFVALKAECNSKLAVALTIMEECFLSMVDPITGIDMIPHIVYNWGSEFPRLNYSGFYTVLLEKDDVLMSVASIRIHGVAVAEMPLIATCNKYRRQGMCRRLMNSIEEMLRTLKVKKLVISALPSLVETWTVGFGFEPMDDSERMSLSDVNLMVFPGTIWLKKLLIHGNQERNLQGSGHASPSIIDDPTQMGTFSEGGRPIVESRKQTDGSSYAEEVGASMEIRHAESSNTQAEEGHGGTLQKRFSNLLCEDPVSVVDGSVSHVESVGMYDERILSSNRQSEKAHML